MRILLIAACLAAPCPPEDNLFNRLAQSAFNFGFECAVNRLLQGETREQALAYCQARFDHTAK